MAMYVTEHRERKSPESPSSPETMSEEEYVRQVLLIPTRLEVRVVKRITCGVGACTVDQRGTEQEGVFFALVRWRRGDNSCHVHVEVKIERKTFSSQDILSAIGHLHKFEAFAIEGAP